MDECSSELFKFNERSYSSLRAALEALSTDPVGVVGVGEDSSAPRAKPTTPAKQSMAGKRKKGAK